MALRFKIITPKITCVSGREQKDGQGGTYDMTRWFHLLTALATIFALAGCSWFGGKSTSVSQPVLTIGVGQCFASPTSVHTELKSLKRSINDELMKQKN